MFKKLKSSMHKKEIMCSILLLNFYIPSKKILKCCKLLFMREDKWKTNYFGGHDSYLKPDWILATGSLNYLKPGW
jgi:hypothetical protein